MNGPSSKYIFHLTHSGPLASFPTIASKQRSRVAIAVLIHFDFFSQRYTLYRTQKNTYTHSSKQEKNMKLYEKSHSCGIYLTYDKNKHNAYSNIEQ